MSRYLQSVRADLARVEGERDNALERLYAAQADLRLTQAALDDALQRLRKLEERQP